ncbi:ankyrin repeat domain-containing protein [Leptotrichia sp. OH3620_COT-345]|nr:ankyrin repeat domain-containing protein [Leptotrichia sp. OH3620_COT-345]
MSACVNIFSVQKNTGELKTVDFVKKARLEKIIDVKLKLFFSAIKDHNNKYVKAYLNTKENREKKQKQKLKLVNDRNNKGVYGAELEMEIVAQTEAEDVLIDVNSKDRYGYTPIIVAIESGNNEILKFLIENGADVREKHPVFGKLTLHTACYYENEEAVEILLKTAPDLVNEKSGTDGWTPLEDATLKSNTRIVKLLLLYGANPLIKDNNGGTAMDMATEFGKGEIVKLLRDKIKEIRREN